MKRKRQKEYRKGKNEKNGEEREGKERNYISICGTVYEEGASLSITSNYIYASPPLAVLLNPFNPLPLPPSLPPLHGTQIGYLQTWLLYHNALSSGVVIEDVLKHARKTKEMAGDEVRQAFLSSVT